MQVQNLTWCWSAAGKPWAAIEIKRSTAPTLGRGFEVACTDLGIENRYVVYPGTQSFPMRHGAMAMGLPDLMAALQSNAP